MQTGRQEPDRSAERARQEPGDIYVSIVPFAKDVNVGASNYNAAWIDWTDWDADNGTCSATNWNQ